MIKNGRQLLMIRTMVRFFGFGPFLKKEGKEKLMRLDCVFVK